MENNTNIPNPTYLNVEYLFFQVLEFFRAVGRFFAGGDGGGSTPSPFNGLGLLRVLATFLIILLITLILYCLVRLIEMKKEREKRFKEKFAQKAPEIVDESINPKWERVESHAFSENPNDWRLAVIEADTILEEELRERGFPGDTLGERLQSDKAKNLETLNDAWEAHKVRNKIAHEGSDFIFSKPEARKTIEQYKRVFQEIGFLS